MSSTKLDTFVGIVDIVDIDDIVDIVYIVLDVDCDRRHNQCRP